MRPSFPRHTRLLVAIALVINLLLAASVGVAGRDARGAVYPRELALSLPSPDADVPAILEFADRVLVWRTPVVTALMGESMNPLLMRERSNLALASQILSIAGSTFEDRLARAGAIAIAASEAQARQQGFTLSVPETHDFQGLPSKAVFALASSRGVLLSATQLTAVEKLDSHAHAREIAGVVSAYAAFDAATQRAYDPLASAEPDLGEVYGARHALLKAVLKLARAVENAPRNADPESCDPFQLEDLFAIDPADCSLTYAQDFALVIDLGGDDVYLNNAGGTGFRGHVGTSGPTTSAALIDIGGDDRYLPGRGSGVNGGGQAGAGFLFDYWGDDVFVAGNNAVNGGAELGGLGFLVNIGGDDRYEGGSGGVNGGGITGGAGFLFDDGGSDYYRGLAAGVNGGGMRGVGLLLDTSGDDEYLAAGLGGNGGAYAGDGFLMDLTGNDRYRANATTAELESIGVELPGHKGMNGGAAFAGTGFLLDGSGSDLYDAGRTATNGGGYLQSVGMLIDARGNDEYTTGGYGSNGGGLFGAGFLIDALGRDIYSAKWDVGGSGLGINGGTAHSGAGLLYDGAGNDVYLAGGEGANGAAFAPCVVNTLCLPPLRLPWQALLLDVSGFDWYEDEDGGTGYDVTRFPKGDYGAQVDLIGVRNSPYTLVQTTSPFPTRSQE